MSARGPRWLPIRVAYAVGAAVGFIGWGLSGAILAWLVIPVVNWIHRNESEEERILRCQRILGAGHRALIHYARWSHQVHFHPKWAKLTIPDEPVLIVANHPTLVDVCTVSSVHHNLCVLAKPKMIRNAFIGRALRAAGHIEAPGRNRSTFAGASVVAAGVDRLKRGLSILIFPEGTRSPPGSVGEMTRGAFEIAKRAGVPIIPIFIHVNPPTLHHGMKWYSLPKESPQYSMTQLPTVDMDRFGGDTKRAAIHFRELFLTELARTQSRLVVAEASETTRNAGATT